MVRIQLYFIHSIVLIITFSWKRVIEPRTNAESERPIRRRPYEGN